MPLTKWTVETPETESVTTRFADAVRTYHNCAGPKRLLRNGRPLRIQTADDQLDLFEETPCSSS